MLTCHSDVMTATLRRRWEEAIEHNKAHMALEDLEVAERFNSPEAILDDLEQQQQSSQNNWLRSFSDDVRPFLRCLEASMALLDTAMTLCPIEVSLACGFLSILLRVCSSYFQRHLNNELTLYWFSSDFERANPPLQ